MLTAFLVQFIPERRRVPVFAIAALACLPAIVVFIVQLALAKNANQKLVFTLVLTAAVLGSLAHGCILSALVLRKGVFFWIADLLIVIGIIGLGLAMALGRIR